MTNDVLTELFTTIGGGLALITIALTLKKVKPHWHGLRAAVMLAGGIVAIAFVALILRTGESWTSDGLQWLHNQSAGIPWPPVRTLIQGLLFITAVCLPWIIAAWLAVHVVVDMFPRLHRLRSGGGESMGRGGMAISGRFSQITEAHEHTMWSALFVPAAVMLLPPLAEFMPHIPGT